MKSTAESVVWDDLHSTATPNMQGPPRYLSITFVPVGTLMRLNHMLHTNTWLEHHEPQGTRGALHLFVQLNRL